MDQFNPVVVLSNIFFYAACNEMLEFDWWLCSNSLFLRVIKIDYTPWLENCDSASNQAVLIDE